MESPEMHTSPKMQEYIDTEVSRPCKQWVQEVINSKRETERVRLRTEHYVLLPDIETNYKRAYFRIGTNENPGPATNRTGPALSECPTPINQAPTLHNPTQNPTLWSPGFRSDQRPDAKTDLRVDLKSNFTDNRLRIDRRWRARKTHAQLHWLAVVTDTRLRTLRDLRGEHIPILQQMYVQCCAKIHEETGISADQIMAYIHYPPSVYQLHVHFKHPIGLYYSHDIFRIHPLPYIINNLQVDPEYYARSPLLLPVYPSTELYTALGLGETLHGNEWSFTRKKTMPIDHDANNPNIQTTFQKANDSESQIQTRAQVYLQLSDSISEDSGISETEQDSTQNAKNNLGCSVAASGLCQEQDVSTIHF